MERLKQVQETQRDTASAGGQQSCSTGNSSVSQRSVDSCHDCGSDTVQTDHARAEVVCQECGIIVDSDRIDRGAEWTAFTAEERETQSRVGSPLSEAIHDKGLTTEIHWQNVDANGQSLSPTKRRRIRRLRRWQERMRTEGVGEQNLQIALVEIHRMASSLGLPQTTREDAAVLYRDALEQDLIQGRSIEGVATAALYTAARKQQIPRSLDEFETVARIERIEIARSYRYLAVELNLEMKPVDPRLYVPRFCSTLDLGKPIQRRAIEILDTATDRGLHSGKSPTGLASGAIYTAALENDYELTQTEVAAVANVTAVTVRNHHTEQKSLLD